MALPVDELAGRTVMVLGGPGTGKTAFARDLAGQLAPQAGPVALLSADMGQQSLGVPTCLGLSAAEPYEQASAMWFVGDKTPSGNFLPTVVGTARLAGRARADGARTVVIDTTGLVDGAPSRVLKYHKVLAAGVDAIVALERSGELEAMLALLGGICPTVHRTAALPEAKDRDAAQRSAYRRDRYRAYFQDAELLKLDASRLVVTDWIADPLRKQAYPAPGAVVGLLDREGFCHAIGLIEKLLPGRLVVYTPWRDPESVACLKLGQLHLDRQADYAETR